MRVQIRCEVRRSRHRDREAESIKNPNAEGQQDQDAKDVKRMGVGRCALPQPMRDLGLGECCKLYSAVSAYGAVKPCPLLKLELGSGAGPRPKTGFGECCP